MVPERTQARANPARGIALIATAVIVGIFLLRNGWDNGGSVAASTGGDNPAADGAAGGTDGSTETTAAPQARPPGEVTVRVANASGVAGAAAGMTDQLIQAGYVTVEATNAPEGTDPNVTVILYTAGYELEAANLAQAVGAAPTAVQALADPPPVDRGGAQLIVMLGTDRAGGG